MESLAQIKASPDMKSSHVHSLTTAGQEEMGHAQWQRWQTQTQSKETDAELCTQFSSSWYQTAQRSPWALHPFSLNFVFVRAQVSLVQFKVVSKCSGKPIGAPSFLSELCTQVSLVQFKVVSNCSGKLIGAPSFLSEFCTQVSSVQLKLASKCSGKPTGHSILSLRALYIGQFNSVQGGIEVFKKKYITCAPSRLSWSFPNVAVVHRKQSSFFNDDPS